MKTFKIDATPAERPCNTIEYQGRTWATDGAGLYDVALWPDRGVSLDDGLIGYRWIPAGDVPTFDDMIQSMLDAPALDVATFWRVQDDALILRGETYYAFHVRFAPVIGCARIEIVCVQDLTCARCWVGDQVVAVLASMRSKVESA